MTGLRFLRVEAAEHAFGTLPVLDIDFIEQLLERRDILLRLRIVDEFRRKPAAIDHMDLSDTFGMQ